MNQYKFCVYFILFIIFYLLFLPFYFEKFGVKNIIYIFNVKSLQINFLKLYSKFRNYSHA